MISKPMLAYTPPSGTQLNLQQLIYPIYVSPKLDGIRCFIADGTRTRKLKPIPNDFTREWINQHLPDGFDGELIAGETFNETQSAIMTKAGEPDFRYWLFDYVKDSCDKPFNERYNDLRLKFSDLPAMVKSRVYIVPQYLVEIPNELLQREEQFIQDGYEGAIIRSIGSPYKCGRSTLREGYLLKLKRFEDAEATIVGFEEQMHNTNEATLDELGHTKRSSCKEGMIPAGTLGKLILMDADGFTFPCGRGKMTKQQAQDIWHNRQQYIGRIVTFMHQPSGAKDGYRFPRFKGFRHEDDMEG